MSTQELIDEAISYLKKTTLGYNKTVAANPNNFANTNWGKALTRLEDAKRQAQAYSEGPYSK